MYTKKATDVRMRTSKKNESGILNQNLCGSNQGYSTWKKGDPEGNGFTFCNTAYTGAHYNFGNPFREKDIGNLIQLIFESGDYFRFKNIEMIADSHFGHLTPVAFLSSWGVTATCSFNVKNRSGVKKIPEFSKQILEKEDVQAIINERVMEESVDQKFDPYASSSSSESEEEIEEKVKVRKMTRLKLFEKLLQLKEKGSYKVWKTTFRFRSWQ